MNSSYSMNHWNEVDFQSWHDWIGNRVSINGNKEGVLKYFGETKFADGIWCGVELEEPVGKNDGSVKGIRYFNCRDRHGIFVPLSRTVKLLGDVTFTSEQQNIVNPSVLSNLRAANLNCREVSCAQDNTIAAVGSLFPSNDNRVCTISDSTSGQKIDRPLNESYLISELLNEDILNKTVIIGEENNLTFRKGSLNHNNKTFTEENSVLNATFDIGCVEGAKNLVNDNENPEKTFVLDEQNNTLEANSNLTFEKSVTHGESSQRKAKFEEPSILSLSQMKDFTVCLDSSFCDNFEFGKLPQMVPSPTALFSNDQAIAFDSKIFEIKSSPKAALLEDSVLHIESEDGYKEFLQKLNASFNKSTESCNDEVMEHSFQLGEVQSSTPSEQSKNTFKKKMSLIRSFQYEENNTSPVVGPECQSTEQDSIAISEQPCKAGFLLMGNVTDLQDLLLEGNEAISVLLNTSIQEPSPVHQTSDDSNEPNANVTGKKKELLSLTEDCQDISETQEKSEKIIKYKSLGNLRQDLILSDSAYAVDSIVPQLENLIETQTNNTLNITIANGMEISGLSESISDLSKVNLEKELIDHKENDLQNVSETKGVCPIFNTTICLNDEHPVGNTESKISNSVPSNNGTQNLNATVCLHQEGDQNLTFDMGDITYVETNSVNAKTSFTRKTQPPLLKNAVPNENVRKLQRPKNLPLVDPKRLTLPAVSAKVKTNTCNTLKCDNADTRVQRKTNKCDVSKVASNECKEKIKSKKEVTSKPNISLKMSGVKTNATKPLYCRQSISVVPQSKAAKNAYNYQRANCLSKKENVPEDNSIVKRKITPNMGNRSFVFKESTIKSNVASKSPDEDVSGSHPPVSPVRRDSIQSTNSQSSKQSSKIAVLQKKTPISSTLDVQNSSKADQKLKKSINTPRFKIPLSAPSTDGLPNRTVRKSINQSSVGKSSDVALMEKSIPRNLNSYSKLKPPRQL